MIGSNCALYGCPTRKTHEFAIFKIPVVGVANGEETAAKTSHAREEMALNCFKDYKKDGRSLKTN